VALPFTLKKYLNKAKRRRIMETQIFISPCKSIIFPKNPLKETKILPDIIVTL
jgi:hypothetical protein